MSFDPSILLVVPERWLRVLLHAELRARGLSAVGIRDLGELVGRDHGPVKLILVDHEAIRGRRQRVLDGVRQRYPGVPIVLLAGMEAGRPSGPWNAVVSRPTTIAEISNHLEQLAALAAPSMMASG